MKEKKKRSINPFIWFDLLGVSIALNGVLEEMKSLIIAGICLTLVALMFGTLYSKICEVLEEIKKERDK